MTVSPQILVVGASGYVGGRLVARLLDDGRAVRCMTRSPDRLRDSGWLGRRADAESVEVVAGDLDDADSLADAFAGIGTVVYLAHSLDSIDFEERERRQAHNARLAAERAGVEHIVYLSGLGRSDEELSPHLRSRHRVGVELASGAPAVTELRAAVVLGAGSASFEMMRSLVDVLPVMVTPQWVTSTYLQPIAIDDVLRYLLAAIDRGGDDPDGDGHRVIGVGGPDVLTYRELMETYASIVGLRRVILPVPVLSLGLSTHWVNLMTPLPRNLAAALIESLSHDVVVEDPDPARSLSGHEPVDVHTAIRAAIAAVDDLDIPTRWVGLGSPPDAARPKPWDPDWSGGTVQSDVRERVADVPAAEVQRTVRGIGGDRGWFGFGVLWGIRGVLDQVVGGVGLRRGRRHPDEITVGEALDFWRVERVEDDLFRLRAEMKLPGDAWLEWATEDLGDGRSRVVQRARFVPAGILGRAYWWVLVPFHAAIFPIMLRRIVSAAESDRSI